MKYMDATPQLTHQYKYIDDGERKEKNSEKAE